MNEDSGVGSHCCLNGARNTAHATVGSETAFDPAPQTRLSKSEAEKLKHAEPRCIDRPPEAAFS